MEKIVWGDLLFFINFCMDFQCLFLAAKLLRRPFSVWRGALFSALGAVYAVAALFLQTTGVGAFLADLGVCFLMCVGVFLERDLRVDRILTPFGVYFGVSFAVGGVMSGMAALLSHWEFPLASGGREISSPLFFMLAAAGGVATFLWGRFCQQRAKGTRAFLRAAVTGVEGRVRCMVDTANLLRDPVSGRPVALLSPRAAEQMLPAVLIAAAARGDPAALADLPTDLARRVRLLPAATVTGARLVFAVAPDLAFLDSGKGEQPVELLLAPVPWSGDTDDYEALLPAELLIA